MIKKMMVMCALILSLSVTYATAADVEMKVPIKEAFDLEKVKAVFSGDIAFYWGNQGHPKVLKKFGTYKTSKRANGFAKAKSDACSWAMASALRALEDRAVREGGNAVINIVSNIKNHEESSTTEFNCLAGAMMVNVALKGTVVTLAK